jgi:hypothetical protein
MCELTILVLLLGTGLGWIVHRSYVHHEFARLLSEAERRYLWMAAVYEKCEIRARLTPEWREVLADDEKQLVEATKPLAFAAGERTSCLTEDLARHALKCRTMAQCYKSARETEEHAIFRPWEY